VSPESLEKRVVGAAEAALAERSYVAPLDVLVGMGWLAPARVDEWRQGRLPCLERGVQANLTKVSTAMRLFRQWARARGLTPSETGYVSRTRDRRRLQFSVSGDLEIERSYRTHWVSPELSETKRRRLGERQSRPPDLVVISAINDWVCCECSATGDLLILEGPGPVCLRCADLDHLVFLAAGDAALTRRAKRASGLSAVVVRFSRARKRYERQGILVEDHAVEQAERECFDDDEARRRRRERDEVRRADLDVEFQSRFAAAIAGLFPACPAARAQAIAEHAALRGSGRVGRSAAGRALDPVAVTAAVVASVRHTDTAYDDLLIRGTPRLEARALVRPKIERMLDGWRPPKALGLRH
jgi:hypothetical protein